MRPDKSPLDRQREIAEAMEKLSKEKCSSGLGVSMRCPRWQADRPCRRPAAPPLPPRHDDLSPVPRGRAGSGRVPGAKPAAARGRRRWSGQNDGSVVPDTDRAIAGRRLTSGGGQTPVSLVKARRSPILCTILTRSPRLCDGNSTMRASSSAGMTYSFDRHPLASSPINRAAAAATSRGDARSSCTPSPDVRRPCRSGPSQVSCRRPPRASAGGSPPGAAGVAGAPRSRFTGLTGSVRRRPARGAAPGCGRRPLQLEQPLIGRGPREDEPDLQSGLAAVTNPHDAQAVTLDAMHSRGEDRPSLRQVHR